MFSPAFTDSDDGALDWPPLFCINHLETDRPRLHCQAHYLPFSTDFAPSAWTDSVTSDEDFENELMTMMTDSAPSDKDFEDELMTTSSHEVAQVENCTPLGEKSAPRQSSRARWTRIQQGEATKTLSKDLAKQEEQRSYLLAWVARKKKGKPFRTLDNAAVAKLVPGDEVHLIAKNSSAYTLDLNVLYLGSDYSIGFMYKGRIHSGGTLKKGLLHINNKSFGREKLLLIATKAPPQSALTDLSWLTQAALQRTRAGPGKKSGFISLLRQSGFGTTTRTATPMSDDEDESAGSIAQLHILTAPSH